MVLGYPRLVADRSSASNARFAYRKIEIEVLRFMIFRFAIPTGERRSKEFCRIRIQNIGIFNLFETSFRENYIKNIFAKLGTKKATTVSKNYQTLGGVK